VEEDFSRKAFYTIGEVSRITGVKTHVLRYWESQGKLLKPNRRGSATAYTAPPISSSSSKSSVSGKKKS
jgi:hypothetical protein